MKSKFKPGDIARFAVPGAPLLWVQWDKAGMAKVWWHHEGQFMACVIPTNALVSTAKDVK